MHARTKDTKQRKGISQQGHDESVYKGEDSWGLQGINVTCMWTEVCLCVHPPMHMHAETRAGWGMSSSIPAS